MFSKHKGDLAEDQAVTYLKKLGFKIVERNYFAKKMGEIDIIATKHKVYHFIEVKSGIDFDPVYNLSPSKLRKIIKSTQLYLKEQHINVPFCIDAIIIRNGDIEFLENITI
jgi:putative endonuclease